MAEVNVKVALNCTWHAKGCSLKDAVRTEITHEDIFVRPKLDDILSEDRAILLSNPRIGLEMVPCELQFRLEPHFKIEALHTVCSAPKVEVFLGSQNEYSETLHGVVLEDLSDEDVPTLTVRTYRYDVEIQKSGVVELTLKLLTQSEEICVFGIFLQAAPNPNGITTLSAGSINLENVQQILGSSGQKLSPNAEKCKLFMEMYNKSTKPSSSTNETPQGLYEHLTEMLAAKSDIVAKNSSPEDTMLHKDIPELKSHIDKQLQQLEERLNARLDALEAEQTWKIDRILMLMEEAMK